MIRCRFAPAAFTLIELLAVIAIAAMVVTLATVSVSAASAEAVLVKTQAALAQLDARGRMHARTSGEAVVLVIDSEARLAWLIGQRSGTPLAEMAIPRDIALTIELPHGIGSILFDRTGVSADYGIVLRGGERSRRLTVAGLTGEVNEREVTP